MKYRMLAIDLDGTLLDPRGHLSPENLNAVRCAQDAGALVVLCTGRGLKEAQQIIDQVGHDCPAVLAGGAQISDPATGQTLYRAGLEPHVALDVVMQLAPHGAALALVDPQQTEVDYIVVNPGAMTDNTRWWFERLGAKTRELEQPTLEDMHHVIRAGMVGFNDDMAVRQAELEQRFGDALCLQHFQAVQQEDGLAIHVLEVFAAGVNKWSGLQWLAELHDIAPDRIAAIGDHINDVSMVRHAACGIAMANAVDEVRAVADHVTHGHDASGVAMAIVKMLDGTW